MKRHNFDSRVKERQEGARIQRVARDARSPEQQLAHLDRMLGKGVGARRERERLNALIAANKNSKKKRENTLSSPS